MQLALNSKTTSTSTVGGGVALQLESHTPGPTYRVADVYYVLLHLAAHGPCLLLLPDRAASMH